MTTPSTNKCCEKCEPRLFTREWCRDEECDCHPKDDYKPTEPSVCLAQVMVGDYPSTCGRPKPCPLHEPSEEKKLVDRQMNQILDNKELTTRGPLHDKPKEVSGEDALIAQKLENGFTVHYAQQEEASWEEEVRVGAPWTQDGKKMLKRIRTVEVQAEKRGDRRGEVRALEWVMQELPSWANSMEFGMSSTRVEAIRIADSMREYIKDRLTALRNTNE